MPRRRSDIDADLQALYDQIPEVACKGLCHTSCGPIRMSNRERARIKEATGINVPDAHPTDFPLGEVPDCPALTNENRCAAYAVRPIICRSWGAAESMPCTYGCLPADGQELMEDEEVYRLIMESLEIGGSASSPLVAGEDREKLLRAARRHRPTLRKMVADGEAADLARATRSRVPGTFSSGS